MLGDVEPQGSAASIFIVAGLTLFASFVCSLLEAALYAITPARIELLRSRGKRGAEKLAHMRADIEAPIAAILTVNTIAHTVGAALCGSLVGRHYGDFAVGVFAAIFTVLVLALTEIVPKSLGVRYATQLATQIVLPIRVMIWTTWPVVWIARKAMRALGGPEGPKGPSEDEVVVVTGMAQKSGRLRSEERDWVENALRLDLVTAGDLRTPRTVVETLPADLTVAEVVAHPEKLIYSRIPIIEGGNPDALVGLIYRRDLFDAALASEGGELTLRDLSKPMTFVPETMPAHELLALFLKERMHMVAVADEYGGFEGVATLEDVLECILGSQIVDEHDPVDDMQELARSRSRSDEGEPEEETDEADETETT